jgi:hypothetical protein
MKPFTNIKLNAKEEEADSIKMEWSILNDVLRLVVDDDYDNDCNVDNDDNFQSLETLD